MKKIIKTLLVVMVLAVVLTAFTGCDAVETLKGIIPAELAAMIPHQFTCSVLGHKGEAYSPCERCGEIWTESAQGRLECNSSGHIMQAYPEQLATCTEGGWSAGVVCTRCGYAERTRFPIPAKGHNMSEATCEDPATCTTCGYEEGEATGHTSVDVEALAPTCSAVGHTAGTQCSVCKKILSGCEEIAIDPTAHKAVDVEALAPTCSTPGHTSGTACELCDEILSGCEEIAIAPDAHFFVNGICGICQQVFEHGYGDNTRVAVETLGVADDGSLYEFIYFYIPAAGHYKLAGENMLITVFTADGNMTLLAISENYLEAGLYVVGLNYYAGVGEYTFNISIVDCTNTEEITKAPTCTETGLKTTTCTVCGHVVEGVEVPVIAHDYKDGYCSCGAVDPDYYFTVTIPEALEKADGSKVIVSGTVVEIYQAYNSQYNNTSVYVADEAGNRILIFRLSGEWGLGDKVTVKGEIDIYNEKAQVAQGATVVSSEKHVCSAWTTATCKDLAACVVCGKTTGTLSTDHDYVDGSCTICGGLDPDASAGNVDSTPVTASKTMKELITANKWTSNTTKQSFKLDDVVSVKINGGSNTGKAYNGDHIRIYATDSPAGTITITVPEGYELVSVKISAQTGTYAFLRLDGTSSGNICNSTVSVSGNSVKINSVKNGSNGKQVRVTAIEVVYKAVAAN